ncbi:type II toxin-antitoxin system PemK/MazF family toxin [Serinibacter salmoneus]|uniref:mRNA interferase MazF n=1 Tax=Serinibacter salmoneus TaxID=556530 RepID=A0A2A9D0F2_9MICO|nr:type II toxin-antitoxin system PemK/MazF family toxin [Serinibacter salmoneus]PFG20167.1 mRNA interferase MazF [Serinibacter salmoneus]
MADDLVPGALVWAELDPVLGREQGGRRPVLVVASPAYLQVVTTLVMVVPVTSVDRGWPNHVPVRGGSLGRPSWVMTEQLRTMARSRVSRSAGLVAPSCLAQVRRWLGYFLEG